MTFSSYWERLLRINKSMTDDESQKLTITVGSLKKLLKRSYDVGRKDENDSFLRSNPLGDLSGPFGDLFGTGNGKK